MFVTFICTLGRYYIFRFKCFYFYCLLLAVAIKLLEEEIIQDHYCVPAEKCRSAGDTHGMLSFMVTCIVAVLLRSLRNEALSDTTTVMGRHVT